MAGREALKWSVEGESGMTLIGWLDDAQVAEVKCGGSHWQFTFAGHNGNGQVRVGQGCDYNPLQMIEAMFNHVINGDVMPVNEVELSDSDTDDIDFGDSLPGEKDDWL